MIRVIVAAALALMLGASAPHQAVPSWLWGTMGNYEPYYRSSEPSQEYYPGLIGKVQTGVDFGPLKTLCDTKPLSVACHPTKGFKPSLDFVREVDRELRKRFVYYTDGEIYGAPDVYNDWAITGDCEDYALTLASILSKLGVSGHWMSLMILEVYDQGAWYGHAMLIVETKDKGYTYMGVNDDETPNRLVPRKGYAFEASIPMDGSMRSYAFDGYSVDGYGVSPNVILRG